MPDYAIVETSTKDTICGVTADKYLIETVATFDYFNFYTTGVPDVLVASIKVTGEHFVIDSAAYISPA